jgi:integrase
VRWSERTQDLNRSLITLHINPIIGNLQLSKLEPQHIAKMQTKIAEPRIKTMQHKNSTRDVKIGGKTTAFQSRALMIHALNTAVKWRILNFNPAAVIDPVKIDREEYQILEPSEVSALLAYALEHNPWLYALMFTGFDNGMRPGELRGFGTEHRRMRSTQTVLEIRRTARPTPAANDPKLWFGPVKTKRSRRDVILSEDNIEALDIQKTLILEHQKKNLVTFKDNGILFPSRAGTPMHGHNLGDDLETLCKKLGLPRITPHDMRHTAISLMIYAGMDIQQIANIVGHASAAFTLQRYAHIFKHQQVAASRIGLKSKLGK